MSSLMGHHGACDDNEKLDVGMTGYSMKLPFFQMIASTAPKKIPPFSTHRTGKRKSDKIHCVLWASGDLVANAELDKTILVPFREDGMPSLKVAKQILVSSGNGNACVTYLSLANRLNEDLRVFDLPTLGFRFICLPDPRPKSLFQSNATMRINIPLANDDNRLASILLLAENDCDFSLIKDIFGPIIVMSRPTGCPRGLKLKDMQAFNKSYLGLSKTMEEFLARMMTPGYIETGLASMFQPMPSARRAYKKQLEGKAEPTDLLCHGPESSKKDEGMFFKLASCGNPGCPHRETIVREELMRCTQCKAIFYCSSTCQRSHWKKHKSDCLKTQKSLIRK